VSKGNLLGFDKLSPHAVDVVPQGTNLWLRVVRCCTLSLSEGNLLGFDKLSPHAVDVVPQVSNLWLRGVR